MKLSTEIITEIAGKLKIQVQLQTDILRIVLIHDQNYRPIICALTLFPNLSNPIVKKIWNEIRHSKFIGETVKKNEYSLRKESVVKLNSNCPSWLSKVSSKSKILFQAYAYDLFLEAGTLHSAYFAKIIEIILDDEIGNVLGDFYNYSSDKLESDSISELVRRAFNTTNTMMKEPFIFYPIKGE